MNNKEKIKKSISKDFDKRKNYNMIMKSINKNKNNFLKLSILPLCILLVLYIGIVLNNKEIVPDSNLPSPIININKLNNIKREPNDFYGSAIDLSGEELIIKQNFTLNFLIPNNLNLYRFIMLYSINQEFIGYNLIYFNSENTKVIDIFYSETRTKRFQCVDIEKNNMRNSKINNIDFLIGNFNDEYFVKFKYNNMYFDIETRGISETELINLLTSIVKL